MLQYLWLVLLKDAILQVFNSVFTGQSKRKENKIKIPLFFSAYPYYVVYYPVASIINVTERTNLGSEFILISLCNTAADVSLFKSKPALAKNLNEKDQTFYILRHATLD